MNYQPYLFNYNIPAENHISEWPDRYLSVIATCTHTSADGTANVFVKLIDPVLYEICQIKNWRAAAREIEQIAQQHFQRLVNLDRRLEAEKVLKQVDSNHPAGMDGWLDSYEVAV